jgi:ribosome maturation factor RimP
MRLSKDISERLNKIVEPVVNEEGFELVDIVFRQEDKRNILDITIDKEDGILVDDCALISGKLSLLLDVEDLIQQMYSLEVGSPGIFRELKRDKDFLRSIGKRVKAVFITSVKGQKQFVGHLNGYDQQVVRLGNEKRDLEVNLASIKKIQLFPNI